MTKAKKRKDLIDRFQRCITRLLILKRFSINVGVEYDIENLEIGELTITVINNRKEKLEMDNEIEDSKLI